MFDYNLSSFDNEVAHAIEAASQPHEMSFEEIESAYGSGAAHAWLDNQPDTEPDYPSIEELVAMGALTNAE